MPPTRQPPGESDGNWIRRARDEVGLTAEQLAHAAGISARSLKDYERGITSPPPPKRVAIEQALRRRREEIGYDDPRATLEDRVRRLEAINLRILQLVEEVLGVLARQAGEEPTEAA